MRYLLQAIALLMLISAFALPAIAAYQAVYVTIAGLLILTALILINEPARANMPVTWILLSAFGLVVLAALLVGPGIAENWLAPGILLLPLLSLGFLSLPNIAPALARMETFAALALAGAGMGVIAGAYELWLGLDSRAGAGNNPIHYGGIVLLLGFAALAGFESSKTRWRYVFLLGPAFGMAGVFLSGSRGPFLAAVMLTAILLPLLLIWNWRDRVFLTGLALCGAVSVASLSFSPLGPRAIAGIGELAGGLLNGSFNVVDEPRSQMLEAASLAFRESPIWGYGWAGMMPFTEMHLPEGSPYKGFDHLHNDFANFAVLGGVLGLAAYGLLIAAPLFGLRSNPSVNQRARLIVAVVITIGFLGLGLTNAMIGILPQTVLYAVLMGMLSTMGKKVVGT